MRQQDEDIMVDSLEGYVKLRVRKLEPLPATGSQELSKVPFPKPPQMPDPGLRWAQEMALL